MKEPEEIKVKETPAGQQNYPLGVSAVVAGRGSSSCYGESKALGRVLVVARAILPRFFLFEVDEIETDSGKLFFANLSYVTYGDRTEMTL